MNAWPYDVCSEGEPSRTIPHMRYFVLSIDISLPVSSSNGTGPKASRAVRSVITATGSPDPNSALSKGLPLRNFKVYISKKAGSVALSFILKLPRSISGCTKWFSHLSRKALVVVAFSRLEKIPLTAS